MVDFFSFHFAVNCMNRKLLFLLLFLMNISIVVYYYLESKVLSVKDWIIIGTWLIILSQINKNAK